MAGHLDAETGKWVDDSPDELRSIDVSDDGLARPSPKAPKAPAPPAAGPVPGGREVAVGDDGLVRPMPAPAATPLSAPLTTIERAKLVQFIQSGNGSPVAVDAARSMLAGGAPKPGLAQVGPTPPQVAGPAPGDDQSNLTPGQRAVILRARLRAQQPAGQLAMNQTGTQGVQ